MNVLLPPQPPLFPHQHTTAARLQQQPTSHASMARKRKADEDNDEMSVSPRSSPATSARQLSRPPKKARAAADLAGRPLPLPRLLETLDATQLRSTLQALCERHPQIGQEILHAAPGPSVELALSVLETYQEKLHAALPYGQSSADYTYFRIKQPLLALIDTILDFTYQFLPPVETQPHISLQYLDGATKFIHDLPEWTSQPYQSHKDSAYDEISKAWVLVINEASKRDAGFALFSGGWDEILAKHNQQSEGRLQKAVNAVLTHSWGGGGPGAAAAGPSSDQNYILNQIMNTAPGSTVRVGPW